LSDFLFDLRFSLWAQGVDGNHVLDQADTDAAGDAANIMLLQDHADGWVILDDLVNSFFPDSVGQTLLIASSPIPLGRFICQAPFPRFLSPEYATIRVKNMIRVNI